MVTTSKIAMSMTTAYKGFNAQVWYMDDNGAWCQGQQEAYITTDPTDSSKWQRTGVLVVNKDNPQFQINTSDSLYYDLVFDKPATDGAPYTLKNNYRFGLFSEPYTLKVGTSRGIVSDGRYLKAESPTKLTMLENIPDHVYAVLTAPDTAQIPTSVPNRPILQESGIKLYPNPAQEFVTIKAETEGRHSFIIYDVLGRKVSSESFEGKEIIFNISDLQTGAYEFYMDGKRERFIKQ